MATLDDFSRATHNPVMTSPRTTTNLHVIKFGGSLLDLPDFPARFAAWRKSLSAHHKLLMVVGGGETADVVRRFDKHYHLTPEQGHWLAIRAMQFNAHCVRHILQNAELAIDVQACQPIWQRGAMAIVDPIPWLIADEARGICVAHRWSFTSDSIAAHLATQLGASRLTLLKSTLPPDSATASQAAEAGIVDPDFPLVSQSLPEVWLTNLRVDPAAQCLLGR